jgi:retron-type reverse transcriptase
MTLTKPNSAKVARKFMVLHIVSPERVQRYFYTIYVDNGCSNIQKRTLISYIKLRIQIIKILREKFSVFIMF